MSDLPPPPPPAPDDPSAGAGYPLAPPPGGAGGDAPGPSARGEGLVETAVGVLTAPVRTLQGLAAEPRVGWAVGVALALGLLTGLTATADLGQTAAPFGPQPEPIMSEIPRGALIAGAAIVGPVFWLVFMVVWSAILHGLARLFGGSGSYRAMFVTATFAGVPTVFSVVSTLLAVSLGLAGVLLGFVVDLGLGVWSVVLGVIAVRSAHRLTTGRAAAVYLLPLALLIVLGIVLVAIAVAVTVGTMGP